jgi:hypothetical protein
MFHLKHGDTLSCHNHLKFTLPCPLFCSSSSGKRLCCPNTFRGAWGTFLQLLDFPSDFKCPECGDDPSIVIMDGKCIKIDINKLHANFEPIHTMCEGEPVPRAHNRTDRQFVHTSHGNADLAIIKNLLLTLSMQLSVQDSNASRPDALELTEDDVCVLWQSAPGYCVGVIQLVCTLAVCPQPQAYVPDGARMECKVPFRISAVHSVTRKALSIPERKCLAKMVKCLASTSPVCAFFSQGAADLIHPLVQDGHTGIASDIAAFREAFREASPIMHNVWHMLFERGLHCNFQVPIWRMFWTELCRLTTMCHDGFDAGALLPINPAAAPSCQGAYIQSGTCTGLKQVRKRFPCEMDGAGNREHTSCRHAFPSGNSTTGGVFTIFCRHGICLAFFILPKAEGRKEIYSYMVKHFARAPRVVVYDYACALHAFFLDRCPGYVKDSIFLVDRIHSFNHKACCPGYKLDNYPHLAWLNSQVAEQCNSELARVEDSIKCMKQETFMMNLAFFLGNRNKRKIEQLRSQQSYVGSLGVAEGVAE